MHFPEINMTGLDDLDQICTKVQAQSVIQFGQYGKSGKDCKLHTRLNCHNFVVIVNLQETGNVRKAEGNTNSQTPLHQYLVYLPKR